MSVHNYFNYGTRSVDSESEGSLADFIVPDEEMLDSESEEERYPLRSRPQKRARVEESVMPRTAYFFEVEGKSSIIGREAEAKNILGMLQQPAAGMRPLLLGPRGIGKRSIVEKTAHLFRTVYNHAPWQGRKIYCLDCAGLIADKSGENSVDKVSRHFKWLLEQAMGVAPQPVIYLRSIEKLLQMEGLSECVQMILEKPYSFIASIAEDIHEEKISKVISQLAQYNFFSMPIKESPLEDVKAIVKRDLNIVGAHFSEEGIDLAVRLAAKHFTQRPLPVRAFNVIQECASAALMNQNAVPVEITTEGVAAFVSSKTGIPPEDLLDDSIFNEERFVNRLKDQIVGQEYAIKVVGERIAGWKMGLLNPHKPWGVFLFVGPTGVGKTELAKQLAKQLFHNEGNVIILDGSEYKEEHTASNLVGAPRGYEGHDSGGMLTGPLIENPYQVVLFDEFEKAHDDVRKLFLQVFDQGRLTDRRGKIADCTKAIFIMTSNLGAQELFEGQQEVYNNPQQLTQRLKPILVDHLSPEMCGRLTAIVPFLPIRQEHLHKLAEVQLLRKRENLLKQTQIDLHWTPALVDHLTKIQVDLRFGARQFCDKVNEAIEKVLKDAMTQNHQRLKGKVTLSINAEGEFVIRVSRGK